MWGTRLKGLVRWNETSSRFASWTGLLLVLMALISVFVALDDTHFPSSASPSGSGQPTRDAVTLTASGNHTYYWDQEGPLPIAGLRSRLAAWIKTAKKPRIAIAGDNKASLGEAVQLISEVRRQGIEDYQIETQPREHP